MQLLETTQLYNASGDRGSLTWSILDVTIVVLLGPNHQRTVWNSYPIDQSINISIYPAPNSALIL
jgi:hypothetical protein